MLILAILLVLIHLTAFKSEDSTSITRISIPIELKNPDHSVQYEFFSFDFLAQNQPRLEFAIVEFCEKYNIRGGNCRKLYSVAEQSLKALKHQYYSERTVNSKLPHLDLSFDEGRSHLIKHPYAIQDEIIFNQPVLRQAPAKDMLKNEETICAIILSKLKVIQRHLTIRRLVFLHSTLYVDQSTNILEELLTSLQSKGLYWDNNLLILLHYGQPLPAHLAETYPEIFIIHVSNAASLFQLPSLRILQKVSQSYLSMSPLSNPHIFYLHTLGQELLSHNHQPTQDLRGILSFYLIEQYSRVHRLLESSLFDVISVNYQANHFPGNFRWTTMRYLADIHPLSSLDIHTAKEKDIQTWILHHSMAGSKSRLYSFHNSHVNHDQTRYPRYCYTNQLLAEDKDSLPSEFATWSKICHNDNEMDYRALHSTEKAAMGVYDEEGSEIKRRRTRADCRALEIEIMPVCEDVPV